MSENNLILKNVKNINQHGGYSFDGITQTAAHRKQMAYKTLTNSNKKWRPRPRQSINLKFNRTFRIRILQYYKKIIKNYDKFIDNLINCIQNIVNLINNNNNNKDLIESLNLFKDSIKIYKQNIKKLLNISKKSIDYKTKNPDTPTKNNSKILAEIIEYIDNIDNNDTTIIKTINDIESLLVNFKTIFKLKNTSNNNHSNNNNGNNNDLIKKIEILENIFNIIKDKELFGKKNSSNNESSIFFYQLNKFNEEIKNFYINVKDINEPPLVIGDEDKVSVNNIEEKKFLIFKNKTESINAINKIYKLSKEIQNKLNKLNLIFENEKENLKTYEIIDKVTMKKLTSFVGNNVNSLLVSIIVTLLLFEFFFRNTYNLMSSIKAYFRSMPKSTNNDNNEWLDNNYYRNKNINNQVLYSLNRLSYNRERKFEDINNIKSNNSINPVIYSTMENNVLTNKDDNYTYGSGGNFIDFLFSVFSPSN